MANDYMDFFGNMQSFESRAEKALLKFRNLPRTGIPILDSQLLDKAWKTEMEFNSLVHAHSSRYMTEWRGGLEALSRIDSDGDALIKKIEQAPIPTMSREEAVENLTHKLMEICPGLMREYARRQAIIEVNKVKDNFAA